VTIDPPLDVQLANCMQQRDDARRELDRALAELAELKSAIGFETSCLNCASVTEASFVAWCRAERAERELARLTGTLPSDVQPVEAGKNPLEIK
jgi:hypothetical protein